MRSRLLVPLLALGLLLAAGLAGTWALLRPRAGSVEATLAEAPGARPGQASSPALRPAGPTQTEAKERAAARSTVEAETVAEAPFPLEDAHWVEVRVARPAGTPPDEALTVRAWGVEVVDAPTTAAAALARRAASAWLGQGRRSGTYEAGPEPDGSFRVAFAQDTRAGQLELDAHYLYLDEPRQVALPADGPVLLEPRLGGRLVARFDLPQRLPEGFDLEQIETPVVQLFGWGMNEEGHQAQATPGPALGLDVGGLHPKLSYVLRVELADLVDVQEINLQFEPGRTLERRFQLAAGARIRGRVTSDAGQPLQEASVQVESESGSAGWFSMNSSDADQTDTDGRFELRGVPTGKSTLSASLEGYVASEPLELELSELQLVEGVELVLPSGERVSGTVTFPDGRPAPGATVQLEQPPSRDTGPRQWDFDQTRNETTDAQGRFSISGLGTEPCKLRVEAPVASDEAAGERVSLHRAEVWRARADGVRPTTEVALVLEPPIAVSGRVVDDVGAPVPRFRVKAGDADEDDQPWRVVADAGEEQTESADGSFELRTLGRGRWRLGVEAEGHGASQERIVTLPGESGPFTFVLPRAASVAGRVLDVSGAPAAGAMVTLSRPTGGGPWSQDSEQAGCDPEGAFRFASVPPGAIELVAAGDDAAPSETLALEVRAAEPLEGLELVLRVGGTLTGEVYRPDGTADAGRQVMAQQPMSAGGDNATTDAAGRFALAHLAPGRYQVMAFPDMDLVQGSDVDPVQMIEQLRMASAEIRDGEVTHVVLGAPPAAPVALTGRVLEADRPASGMLVMALAEGSSMMSNLKSARVDGQGRFAMTLPAPGDWILLIGQDMDGEGSEFPITVPAADSHHVELEIPTGRISGRVLGPDGAPATGVQVTLSGGGRVSIFNTSGGREAQAGSDGRFAFERVRPGGYDLRAGTDSGAGFFGGGGPGYGVAVLGGLVLEEGAALDGLVLQLTRPGTIRGRVSNPDGSIAAEASIWVRDAAGRVLNPRSWCRTDGSGRFSFQGAGRGRHTLLARSATAASAEVAVDVSEGLESEVELVLQSGTLLLVAVEDDEGNALRAGLRVYDDAGREVSGLSSMDDMERAMMEGFSTREQRIGPLAPGRYRVEAVAEDGARAAKPVSLSGQEERRLRLRLKD